MKKRTERTTKDEVRDEYDAELIRKGVRGKYAARYRARTNLVPLGRDAVAAFRDADAVNEALRLLMKVAKTSVAGQRKS